MFRQVSFRLRKPSILLLLATVSATASGSPARLSSRYAPVVAHFDSVVGYAPREAVWRWLEATEAAAPADSSLRLVTRAQRATLLMQWGQYAEARRLAQPSLAHASATNDTLLLCRALTAVSASDMLEGRRAEARAGAARLLAVARAARLVRFQGQAHLELAYLDLLANDFPRAARGYRAALSDFSPGLDAGPCRIARIGLARAYFQMGRTEASRRIDIELVRESRRADDPIAEAYALNNLAVHEELSGDPASAVPCYRRALGLQQRFHRTAEVATTATNLAHALGVLSRFDEASRILAPIADSAGASLPAAERIDLLSQLGHIRLVQCRYDAAEALCGRAWALSESARVTPPGVLVTTRARVLQQRGRTREALAMLEHWLATTPDRSIDQVDGVMVRAATASLLDASGRSADALRHWAGTRAMLDTSTARGQARLAYALLNESLAALQVRDLARARGCLRSAVGHWERGRSSFRNPEWRESAEVLDIQAWGSAIGCLACAPPGAERERGVREGFDLLQRVKARTLEERASGGAARASVRADDLQRTVLREGELALDFYLARDSVVMFAITRGALREVILPRASELDARVTRFTELAGDPSPQAAALREGAAASLSEWLLGGIPDLLAGSRRLIVSGGGLVDDLPWPLLAVPGTGRHLAEAMDVAIAPSLSALARIRAAAPSGESRRLLVIAGPLGPDGRRLAGVGDEVRWLSARYAGTDARTPRSGAEVRAALLAIPRADVVHVAAHVADDAENPWRTGVLLGDPRRDDSWLRAATIATVPTRARLVVLSGCASADAHASGLSGVQGLASAFLAAGAGTVVGTLWPVADAASAEFVRHLYRGLEDGLDVGRSVARAQAEVRQSSRWQDPAHWAGFVVLGDPSIRIRLSPRGLPHWPSPGNAPRSTR